jgi:hypothetical protein
VSFFTGSTFGAGAVITAAGSGSIFRCSSPFFFLWAKEADAIPTNTIKK